MAIEDRNLSVGTKLYARTRGRPYTAEVVLDPNATGDRPSHRVDGKDQLHKSPSAAATSITGKAANGWSFWTVGLLLSEGAKVLPGVLDHTAPATLLGQMRRDPLSHRLTQPVGHTV